MNQPIAFIILSLVPKQLTYLDPGSGSFILQILLASLLGISIAIATFWRKIRGFLGFKSTTPKDGEDELEENQDQE